MQLIPRYLVNNRINLVSNDAGFTVEYRPVYTRELKIYKGIDNKIQFRLLNADQKPVTITGTPIFVAFDETGTKVLEYLATVTDDSSSKETRGMFEVTITDVDLLNIRQQYLQYNIYIKEDFDNKIITYANRNFDNSGTMYIDSRSYPGPKYSAEIVDFYPMNNKWVAGNTAAASIYANPGTNDKEGLYTVSIYSTGYIGTVVIQATLDNQINGLNNWVDVVEITLNGSETEPVTVNFYGIYTYLKIVLDADPAGKIKKILLRN
jgi:hypothetical protein